MPDITDQIPKVKIPRTNNAANISAKAVLMRPNKLNTYINTS